MRKILLLLLISCSFVFGQTPNAWFNEFHYDNVSTDQNEFIEIAIENASSYNLSDFTVTLYNGSNGSDYNTKTLDQFTSCTTVNGVTLFSYTYPTNGIQNGAPDGFSLDYQGNVIQFLSYEGSFTAVSGPAAGMTSTDVGLSENGSTPIGESIFLTGNPGSYTWTKGTATLCQPNASQVLPVELTTFTASVVENNVELKWETATEVNNYGFEIERKTELTEWTKVSFVNGYGNSNSQKYYSFTDNGANGSTKFSYRLKQIDFDGKFEYSDEIEVNLGTLDEFVLNQNYPNPFNPTTKIQFTIPSDVNVKLSVFNVLGEEVAELLNKNLAAGNHSVKFNASEFNSGIYFYKIEAGNFIQIRKMMLVK